MSNRKLGKVYAGAFIVAGAIGLAGCEGASDRAVSYAEDVQPILAEHCLECHRPGAEGFAKSGFGVIGGDSIGSTLVVLIEGRAHSSIQMPHGQQRMPEEQIETVKRWIDQGAMDN